MEDDKELRERIEFKSERRLAMLKRRAKRCRCKYCGGKLKLRRIIFSDYEDARIDIFCTNCNRIEFGVEPDVYRSALYFVDNSGFECYPDLEKSERTRQMTVAKVCEIMDWHDRNMGFSDEEGFKVDRDLSENLIGECVVLDDGDLDEDEEEEDDDNIETIRAY